MDNNIEPGLKLGDKVRDTVSGFTGIVIARTDYLHGTTRFGATSRSLDGAESPKTEWFELTQLEPVPPDQG